MAAKKKATKAKTTKKSTSTRAAATSARAASAKGASARAASSRSEGLSLTSSSPGFTVNDVETSLTWYRDVLGFQVGERWERDGKLLGAELKAGKAWFMIGQDDWKKGRDRIKGQGVRMYCITDQDIDRLAARIKSKGGVLEQEPKDQQWGMRDIAIADPDGYKLTIARPLKPARKR